MLRQLCVLTLLSTICSCSSGNDNYFEPEPISDYPDSHLRVVNRSGDDIFLFNTYLEVSSVLGGVPENVDIGIKPFFGFTVLKVIRYEEYLSVRPDFSNCRVIATAFAYVAEDGVAVKTIKKTNVGVDRVVFRNTSGKYVEIKRDSWYGETATHLAPYEEQSMYLSAGTHVLYSGFIEVYKIGTDVIGVGRRFNLAALPSIQTSGSGARYPCEVREEASPEIKDVHLFVKNRSPERTALVYGGKMLSSTLDRMTIAPSGGAGVYRFSEDGKTFAALTIALSNANGVVSPAFAESLHLNAGQAAYLVYSGSISNGAWSLESDFAAFVNK